MDMVLTKDGGQKRIERRLDIRCSCGQTIASPVGEDPWAWLNGSPDAAGFLTVHQGPDHQTMPMIEFREVD